MSRTLVIVGSLAAAPLASGQASLRGVGCFPDGTFSQLEAVSDRGDGYGWADRRPSSSISYTRAFRWNESTGMSDLGSIVPHPRAPSDVYAVTPDGQTVAGHCIVEQCYVSAAWTAGGGWVALASPQDYCDSRVKWVSPNGNLFGGSILRPHGSGSLRAGCVWRSGQVEFLPEFVETLGAASDGSVVLGRSLYYGQSMTWRPGEEYRPLPALPGQVLVFGEAITPDGSKVVGSSGIEACVWTHNTPRALPRIFGPDWHAAEAISDDGGVIGGAAGYSGLSNAVVWAPLRPARYVVDVLRDAGADVSRWHLQRVVAVSANGRYIGGRGRHFLDPQMATSREEGWVAALPEGFGCYANCDGSTSSPVLTVADFTCFQTRFASGDPDANCDASTATPILNINDYLCFISRFAAGCQ